MRLHLIPSSSNTDIEIGAYNQLPGGARAEAERRRALALKALDQRLANSSSPGPAGSSNPRTTTPLPSTSSNKVENGTAVVEKTNAHA